MLTTTLINKHATTTNRDRYGYQIGCNSLQSLHTCAQPMQLPAAMRLTSIHIPNFNIINGYSIRHYTRCPPPSSKRITKEGSGGSTGPLALEQGGSKGLPSSKFMGALGFTVLSHYCIMPYDHQVSCYLAYIGLSIEFSF